MKQETGRNETGKEGEKEGGKEGTTGGQGMREKRRVCWM